MENSITCIDCIQGLRALPAQSAELVFADPPFNIGYKYDTYHDKNPDYHAWCTEWMKEIWRILYNNGTFWLAIGDEQVAELKIRACHAGFHMRSWVIWYYTFGVRCSNKFSRSHTHLLHFTKSKDRFTFNADAIKVPSARQTTYNDSRAVAGGKVPDDTWILRPQEIEMAETDDVWYAPRVCGTFKERTEHSCQMPITVLERIIRVSSNPGELVVDPFCGSCTTLVAAKRLGRRWIGFDVSEKYVADGNRRVFK